MKHIEEIRKDIFAAFGGYAKWEEDWESLAEAVYNAGYRKQSEVAMEIFEEIEIKVASKIPMKIQPIFKDDRDFEGGFMNGKTDALLDVLVLIAQLKKKYTEVEK